MRIVDLALKDLSQLLRDWKSAAFLVIMPIGFTLLLGFVFSGGGGGVEDPRLPVGFLNQDGGTVSQHLLTLLESSDAIRPIVLEDSDAASVKEQITDGDLVAAVIVPTGYSEQAFSPAEGSAPRLLLLVDPASAAGQAAQNGIEAALVRLLGAVQATRLTAQALEAHGGDAGLAFLQEALARAIGAWQTPPLSVTIRQPGALADETEEPQPEPNSYAHSSAGIMVQFAMAGLIAAAEILVLERKSGALRRLLTTPTARLEIILGHFLAMYVMILFQLVLLVTFGQVFLGVDYLRVPLGTGLMILITAFWAASLGLLLGIVARTEEQAVILSLMTMLLLSGLGGAWMSLEFTSKTFQTVGHLTPVAWAIDGFENMVVRGLGLESVLVPAAILLAYAVVFFAVGVWRFRFE